MSAHAGCSKWASVSARHAHGSPVDSPCFTKP
jgi:hypothetical protein